MLKEIQKVQPHKKQTPVYFNSSLSTDEINELRQAFNVYEEEKDRINPIYIVKMFKDLGYEIKHRNVVDMLEYLTTAEDDNHFISFEQFLEGCVKFLGANTPELDMKTIFNMFIESETNTIITLESFRRMLNALGEDMSALDSTEIFEKNAGEKMYLTYEDFVRIFKQSYI